MARLIPKIDVESISNKPERDVARALIEQLPSDCLVFHSYPWLRADRNDKEKSQDTLNQGEADFIIVLPEKCGFLVLEVKGGSEITYNPEEGRWYRILGNGRQRAIADPFEQARRNTHTLAEKIRKLSFPARHSLPCTYGYAVIFPDAEYQGNLPPGADNAILLTAKDLSFLGRRIPKVIEKWDRRSDGERTPMTQDTRDGIVRGLTPVFKLLPVLFRKIEDQEERLFRLTEEQLRVLDIIKNFTRIAIEGVAGSGKTMLATAQAQRFADRGLKTLFLCYNRALAEWLTDSSPFKYKDILTITTFHQLCNACCANAGIPFRCDVSLGEEFWRNKATELFVDAITDSEMRFDAIVVDEGQDFFPEWWIPLEMINREMDKGPLFIFYDPAQNLFVGDRLSLPPLGDAIHLPTNCRNTRQIAKTCSEISGVVIPTHLASPEGDKTIVRIAPSPREQVQACKEMVQEWLSRGLTPTQITILSPRTRKNSSFAAIHELAGFPLSENRDRWKAGKSLLFATIRSFKGLESDAVIIVDVIPPGSLPHFKTTDLYVGCSRAKHLLVIQPFESGIV